MTTPIVMVVGPAGSGKDTVAGMMAEMGGVCIAQADPLKRFAREVFKFTDDQLWGPSEMRNAVDPRGSNPDYWEMVSQYFQFGMTEASKYIDLWLMQVDLPVWTQDRLGAWFREHICSQPTLTPRHVLQTLGTEFGRKLVPDIWVRNAQDIALALLDQNAAYDRTKGIVPRTEGRTEFVVVTDGRFRNEVVATKNNGGLVLKVTGPQVTGLTGAAGQHQSEQEQNSIPEFWFDSVIWNDKSQGLEKLRGVVKMFVENDLKVAPLVYTHFDRIAG